MTNSAHSNGANNIVICWNSWKHLPRMKSPTGPAIWLNSRSAWRLAVNVVYSELRSQNVRPEFSNIRIAGTRKIVCKPKIWCSLCRLPYLSFWQLIRAYQYHFPMAPVRTTIDTQKFLYPSWWSIVSDNHEDPTDLTK